MSIDPQDLMRYHDGELSPDEATEVERALEDDEEAQEQLLALERLGALTRVWAEQRSAGHGDIVQGVMARIERDEQRPQALTKARTVAPLAASALALAAAAALFITLRRPVAEQAADTRPLAQSARSAGQAPSAPQAVSATASLGAPAVPAPEVAIEAVDFGENHGSIFVVSSERGDTPVVWLSDEPAISPSRTHPL